MCLLGNLNVLTSQIPLHQNPGTSFLYSLSRLWAFAAKRYTEASEQSFRSSPWPWKCLSRGEVRWCIEGVLCGYVRLCKDRICLGDEEDLSGFVVREGCRHICGPLSLIEEPGLTRRKKEELSSFWLQLGHLGSSWEWHLGKMRKALRADHSHWLVRHEELGGNQCGEGRAEKVI